MSLSALAVAAWLRLFDPSAGPRHDIVDPHGPAVSTALRASDAEPAVRNAVRAAGLWAPGELEPFLRRVTELFGELRHGETIEVVEAALSG